MHIKTWVINLVTNLSLYSQLFRVHCDCIDLDHILAWFPVLIHNERKCLTVPMHSTNALFKQTSCCSGSHMFQVSISWVFALKRTIQIAITYEDTQSAFCMMRNPQFHGQSKHTAIECYFIRDETKKGKSFFFNFLLSPALMALPSTHTSL